MGLYAEKNKLLTKLRILEMDLFKKTIPNVVKTESLTTLGKIGDHGKIINY
jgi:hypothetical protein